MDPRVRYQLGMYGLSRGLAYARQVRPDRGEAGWLTDVLGVQFYQSEKDLHDLGVAPYGLSQCRVTLEGFELLVGINLEKVDGEGFGVKVENVRNMDAERILRLAEGEDSGFVFPAIAPAMIMIPPGYVVANVVIGNETVHGLRWSFYGPPNAIERSSKVLDTLIAAYPQIAKSASHTQLRDRLKKMVREYRVDEG
jgi:hypothetical protein